VLVEYVTHAVNVDHLNLTPASKVRMYSKLSIPCHLGTSCHSDKTLCMRKVATSYSLQCHYEVYPFDV